MGEHYGTLPNLRVNNGNSSDKFLQNAKKVFVTNKVYVVKTRAINNLEMCFDNVCVNFSDKAKVMPVVCLLIPELIIVFIYKSRAVSE